MAGGSDNITKHHGSYEFANMKMTLFADIDVRWPKYAFSHPRQSFRNAICSDRTVQGLRLVVEPLEIVTGEPPNRPWEPLARLTAVLNASSH
jgi:hypothetical protein